MKLNFNIPLLELGEPVLNSEGEPLMLNKTLATLLGRDSHTSTGIDYMDAIEWAGAINKGETIDLTTRDQDLLKNFIKNHGQLTAFAKASILAVFDNKKEEKPTS